MPMSLILDSLKLRRHLEAAYVIPVVRHIIVLYWHRPGID